MVVTVLFNAGLQLPVTPLSEVVGKGDNAEPTHTGGTCVNIGTILGVTVTVMLAVVAHCPAVGVNVYVVVLVLFQAGLQLPVTPLVEVVAKGDAMVPAHTGGTGVNAGITTGFTVMVIVAVLAHCPAAGVNV